MNGRSRRDEPDEPVEGRVRRGRGLVAGALGLGLLAALPVVFARLGSDGASDGDGGAPTGATGTGTTSDRAAGLHGRLVYTTFESGGSDERQQRLVVVDLAASSVRLGPLVPAAEEIHAAGRRGDVLVLVAEAPGRRGVAFALDDLAPDAEPRELAAGEVLSLSTDRLALVVGRSQPAGGAEGCGSGASSLHRADVASGVERPLWKGRVACGELVSATLDRDRLVASFVRRGRVEVDALWPQNATVLFRDLAHVSISPRGTFLFVEPEGGVADGVLVWPRTPTGRLLVWPGSGTPRPLVDRDLVAQRVLAWSPDGGHVVVSGILDDARGLWLVYVPTGDVRPLLPPRSFPVRSAFLGATFDDAGTAFAGAAGTIVVATDDDVVELTLPSDAPSPAGPVAWLP